MLLLFFALPLATIILAAIFETFINCPLKVAGIAFSIYLIVAFALGGTVEFIVAAIVYTILALITALIVKLIQDRNSSCCCQDDECNGNNCGNNCNCNNNNENNCNCGNNNGNNRICRRI